MKYHGDAQAEDCLSKGDWFGREHSLNTFQSRYNELVSSVQLTRICDIIDIDQIVNRDAESYGNVPQRITLSSTI
jgi:hypothetical protein